MNFLTSRGCAAVVAGESGQNAWSVGRDPWSLLSGWRPNGRLVRALTFGSGEHQQTVMVEYSALGYVLRLGEQEVCLSDVSLAGQRLCGLTGSESFTADIHWQADTLHLFDSDGHHVLQYQPQLAHAGDDTVEGGSLTAPMPGKVIALLAKPGEKVSKGQALVVMEAMKMEHTIAAPADGEVTRHPFAVGDQVAEGVELIGFSAL